MRKRWFTLLGMLVVLTWAGALAQDVTFGPSIKVNDDPPGWGHWSPTLAVD